jgi:hypothetical protein
VTRAPSLLCGTLVLFGFIWARTSLAAKPDARPGGRQVDLIVGATASDAQLLEPPIREMLVAKGLEVAITRKPTVTTQDVAAAIAPPQEATPRATTPTLARVLLDFTVPGEATLLLIDPNRGRVFARRMVLASGLDAVARASVRFVVEQSIDAILEGRDIGVSREEFQRSVAPPPPIAERPPVAAVAPPPPPALPDRRLLLAGGYEGVAMGSGDFQHAAKIVLAARFTRLEIGAAARLAAPISIAGDGIEARLSTIGASVFGAAKLLRTEDLAVSAGVAVGLDLTRAEATVTTPDLQPAASSWSGGPLLQPFAQVERMFGRISIALTLGAEAHLLAERYVVMTGTETRDVFTPRRIRPTAAALVGFVF